MKLLELYALTTGQKIGTPFIHTAYYPINFNEYITVHASSGMDSKNYSYWSDVVAIMKKYRPSLNFIQIGSFTVDSNGVKRYDSVIEDCEPFHLKDLNIHQTAYILKNAMLHLGNDSFSAHVAGSFGIPMVVPYGATSAKNHSPYIFNLSSVFIESDRDGNKPSFLSFENPKTVNFINPETIACAALNILNFTENIPHKTFYIGKHYPSQIFEYIPDKDLIFNIPDGIINVRMDYHFDENYLAKILSARKCKIISDKKLNLNLLKQFKKNIFRIQFSLNDDIDLAYVNSVKSVGVEIELILKEIDSKKISDKRLEFFDYFILDTKHKDKPDFDLSSLRFKTRKFILSNGKIYLSKAHWKVGIEAEQGGYGNVINSQDFIDEMEHFYIFKE